MKFEAQFNAWLLDALKEPIPVEVKAFCFNLASPAYEEGVKYCIEIVGAERFDLHDENWGCDEIWRPSQYELFIPISFSTIDWEICQFRMKQLLEAFMKNDNCYVNILKQREGMGIGFVDGHLDIIWVRA
jgi:hypothetical protein